MKSALTAPRWGHVRDYLGYVLDLAVAMAGARVLLEFTSTPIEEIQETTPDGRATIRLTDGKRFAVDQLVRPRRPPHLTGVPPHGLVSEARGALIASGLSYEETKDESYFVFTIFRRTVMMTHEEGEASLSVSVPGSLAELKSIKASELWVVTRDAVGDAITSVFENQPVHFYTLKQFTGMMEVIKLFGVDALRRG